MARVLLVNFAGCPCTYSSLIPDNGLAALAGVLKDASHPVRIIDFGTPDTLGRLFPPAARSLLAPLARRLFDEHLPPRPRDLLVLSAAHHLVQAHSRRAIHHIADEVADHVRQFRADLVGLKLWNGDGLTASALIARRIKQTSPNVVVFGGGPQVDWFGRHVLDRYPAFDGLARGDGELAIAPLAEYAERKRPLNDVPNVIHRSGETAPAPVDDLDGLPLPCYEDAEYPAAHGAGQLRFVVIDESRGCPCSCAFCIHPVKSGGRWLVKSAPRVVHEIIRARSILGARRFVYAGSNTPARAADANAAALIDAATQVEYACFGHARSMRSADFPLLRRSGCRVIFYGVESGDQRLLDRSFHKLVRVEDLRDVLARTKAAGITTIASIIFPAPGEDEASERATTALLLALRPDAVPVQFPGLIPGSDWWNRPGDFGFRLTRRGRRLWAYALGYKIKLLFPPRLWRPLPYRIDGQSCRRVAARTELFCRKLEAAGLTTGLGHDLALMAHALNMPLRDFRDRSRRDFFTGDVDAVREIVQRVNAAPVATLAPAAPRRKEVAAP